MSEAKLDGVRARWDLVRRSTPDAARPLQRAALVRRGDNLRRTCRSTASALWAGRGTFEMLSGLVRRTRPDEDAWRAGPLHGVRSAAPDPARLQRPICGVSASTCSPAAEKVSPHRSRRTVPGRGPRGADGGPTTRYSNPDDDPRGPWKPGDLSACCTMATRVTAGRPHERPAGSSSATTTPRRWSSRTCPAGESTPACSARCWWKRRTDAASGSAPVSRTRSGAGAAADRATVTYKYFGLTRNGDPAVRQLPAGPAADP